MGKLTRTKFMSLFEGALVPPSLLNQAWKEIELELYGDEKANSFIATYIRAYQARYATQPLVGGKNAGIAKRIVREHGTDLACRLVTAYLHMSEFTFVRAHHSLECFERNIQAVANYAETGKTTTRTEAHRIDKAQANDNAFNAVIAKRRGGHGQ